MPTLYPRLLKHQAEELYRRQMTCFLEGGGDPQSMTKLVVLLPPNAVFAAIGGTRASEQQLREVRDQVVAAAKKVGYPHPLSRNSIKLFDPPVARILHERMGMTPSEASSQDIWAYLALCLLPDVAWWRFPNAKPIRGESGKGNLERFVQGDLTRQTFGRLWWRAHLVHVPGDPAPYWGLEDEVLEEADFDHMQARREQLGASPRLVRSLMAVWQETKRSGALDELNSRGVWRDALKRYVRLFPFVDFETMDEETRLAEIRRVMGETLQVARDKKSRLATQQPSQSGARRLLGTVGRAARKVGSDAWGRQNRGQ